MSTELESYEGLYRFLRTLSDELGAFGLKHEAEKIDFASSFYGGSPSEFLGETRIALLAIRDSVSDSLLHGRLDQMDAVVQKINDAFRAVGGT